MIHEAMVSPQFAVLSGGGPTVTNSQGVPWQGAYVNSNGDLTVDLRSDMAAESRAKSVYEYLLQFTDDPLVQESLKFLMTREIACFQMFGAALETLQPNFPPVILQGEQRFTHLYFNMSDGASSWGPWNEGQGPWGPGEQWVYIEDPIRQVQNTRGQLDTPPQQSKMSQSEAVHSRSSWERSAVPRLRSTFRKAEISGAPIRRPELASPKTVDTAK